jgi:hypothetical protein
MADTPAPQPGTIAYAEWKRHQEQQRTDSPAHKAAQPGDSKGDEKVKSKADKGPGEHVGRETRKYTDREAGKQATKEVTRLSGRPDRKDVSRDTGGEAGKPALVEDLPNHKVGYYFTQAEIDSIDELQHILIHQHRLRNVTKSDIVRTAVSMLIKDFDRSRATSFLIRRLTKR